MNLRRVMQVLSAVALLWFLVASIIPASGGPESWHVAAALPVFFVGFVFSFVKTSQGRQPKRKYGAQSDAVSRRPRLHFAEMVYKKEATTVLRSSFPRENTTAAA